MIFIRNYEIIKGGWNMLSTKLRQPLKITLMKWLFVCSGLLISALPVVASPDTDAAKTQLEEETRAEKENVKRQLKAVRTTTISKLEAQRNLGTATEIKELNNYLANLNSDINKYNMAFNPKLSREALLIEQFGETTENLLKQNHRSKLRQIVRNAVATAEGLATGSDDDSSEAAWLRTTQQYARRQIPNDDAFISDSEQRRIVIEGELMPWKRSGDRPTDGAVHRKGGNFGREQYRMIWNCARGEILEFTFLVPRDGTYNLSMHSIYNKEHGTFKYSLDTPENVLLESYHLYHSVLLFTKPVPLGIRKLKKGEHKLIVETLAPHPLRVIKKEDSAGHFGLDCLVLERLDKDNAYPTSHRPAEADSTQWVGNRDGLVEEISLFPGGKVLWSIGEDPLLGNWSRLSDTTFSIKNEIDKEDWIFEINAELARGRMYQSSKPETHWPVIRNKLLRTTEYNGSYYILLEDRQYGGGREKAAFMARALGGHLAKIENEAENNAVKSLRKGSIWYIGVWSPETWGDWRWDDGSAVSQFFWRKGEPNNARGFDERAVVTKDGTWIDVSLLPNRGVRGAMIEYRKE